MNNSEQFGKVIDYMVTGNKFSNDIKMRIPAMKNWDEN